MTFNFQKIVATIAIIIFIILMIFIALILSSNKTDVSYPPTVSQCPDYWIDQQSDSRKIGGTNTQKCVNIKNLGNSACSKEVDFTTEGWQGSAGSCNKYKWARACDLTWDGVTNKPDICN